MISKIHSSSESSEAIFSTTHGWYCFNSTSYINFFFLMLSKWHWTKVVRAYNELNRAYYNIVWRFIFRLRINIIQIWHNLSTVNKLALGFFRPLKKSHIYPSELANFKYQSFLRLRQRSAAFLGSLLLLLSFIFQNNHW